MQAPKTLLTREAEWYGALTLTERARLVTGVRPDAAGDLGLERAHSRLRRWRSALTPAGNRALAQRLAAEGLTEIDLERILAVPSETLRDCSQVPPDWLLRLAEAFAPRSGGDSSAAPDPGAEKHFVVVAAPLVAQGRRRLRQGLAALMQDHPNPPFDAAEVEGLLTAQLQPTLARMVGRTLTLELNVARLEKRLPGETPEERYQSFVARLADPAAALAILRQYPVLARQIVVRVDQWVDIGLELLSRLCADWSAIGRAFGAPASGRVVEIAAGAGDSHRSGRSVAVLRFDGGFRVVYKPRSLRVDVHFQELVDWLNQRGDHPPLRVPRALDRGRHGWTEFIEAAGCDSAEEVQRFYRRQGAWLALLYTLEATDYHCENLIASGEHPIPVDFESLFHPRLAAEGLSGGGFAAGRILSQSVLRTGLLPFRFGMNVASEGLEISGLGGAPGQLSLHPGRVWERPGTDEMRVTRKRLEIRASQNRPSLNGAEVNALDYAAEIVAGFDSLYRTLVRRRTELLAKVGPLEAFGSDPVRAILRPTHTYAQLLEESFHPDLLQDALEREAHFDRLWVTGDEQSWMAGAQRAERDDLAQMDVPVFATAPGSRDLYTSQGTRLAGACEQTGLERTRQRIERLDEEDRLRQEWIIRASLTCLALDQAEGEPRHHPVHPPQRLAGSEELLQAARAVGDRLQTLALGDEQGSAWVTLSLHIDRHWVLEPAETDLYNGIPGMALFLAYLGALRGGDDYTRLARSALADLRSYLELPGRPKNDLGAFSGLGGVIYLLTHLAALWREPALLDQAEALARQVPEQLEQDEALDVMCGCAGCLLCLLALHRCRPSEPTLAAAVQCGERLLQRAQPAGPGLAWLTGDKRSEPLTGMSHGAAGIAWALDELSLVTGDGRFRQAAGAALAYERRLFSPENGNWPDLRKRDSDPADGPVTPHYACFWCHGASGIGLARLQMWRRRPDTELRAEIEAALATTERYGFGHDHSLCHGDFGSLELLLQASQLLGDPEWQARTRQRASAVLESIGKRGWRCGSPRCIETPGLMVGLAGIGYGLLRLSNPEQVPAVLSLEPPRLGGR